MEKGVEGSGSADSTKTTVMATNNNRRSAISSVCALIVLITRFLPSFLVRPLVGLDVVLWLAICAWLWTGRF